jgi:hypothetical protein
MDRADGYVYSKLEPLLPIPCLEIECREIDTPRDLNEALSRFPHFRRGKK